MVKILLERLLFEKELHRVNKGAFYKYAYGATASNYTNVEKDDILICRRKAAEGAKNAK